MESEGPSSAVKEAAEEAWWSLGGRFVRARKAVIVDEVYGISIFEAKFVLEGKQ